MSQNLYLFCFLKPGALELRTVDIVRYVTPLREGGSLPAIVEADDGFLYVLKFRGAGQGVKSLIAELIGGELARALGLRVPEIVFANVDPAFGRTEPDEEIQDLLKASEGDCAWGKCGNECSEYQQQVQRFQQKPFLHRTCYRRYAVSNGTG